MFLEPPTTPQLILTTTQLYIASFKSLSIVIVTNMLMVIVPMTKSSLCLVKKRMLPIHIQLSGNGQTQNGLVVGMNTYMFPTPKSIGLVLSTLHLLSCSLVLWLGWFY
eukprot:Lithocolla_globosa_v1_NODE_2458_length_1996_cov_269.389490.p2 type:complete len:108 gc:universal NODE_2458_length_1996_cov_269.389490:1391-1068(-)